MVTWLIYFTIIPILGGLLAASGFILSKRPDAKQYLDKIAPYQGFIGLAMFADGLINLTNLFHLSIWTGLSKITILILVPSLILVGFLLGFSMAAKYLFRGGGSAVAQQKAANIQKKLAAYSAPLGFASIVGGVLFLISFVILGG